VGEVTNFIFGLDPILSHFSSLLPFLSFLAITHHHLLAFSSVLRPSPQCISFNTRLGL
jgi:hypothetical protein